MVLSWQRAEAAWSEASFEFHDASAPQSDAIVVEDNDNITVDRAELGNLNT